jgi:hypothetical protein
MVALVAVEARASEIPSAEVRDAANESSNLPRRNFPVTA